ncbi:MAG: TetR/AcrR family transcriptional regulator [Myxococcota bacterium]|nr:TetR/AcrR family transcriptional regulator [Myxococcota bacterium]
MNSETREGLRIPGVPAPKPLLSPENERRLTDRQRELLDHLEELVTRKGVAERTMAEIASHVNCSLRTLYGIAPSKEELVLAIVDRRLHRVGRTAIGSIDASLSPLEALRAYLQEANKAVQPEAIAFAEELATLRGAKRLLDAHEGYVIAVTRSLLDRAVAEGEIEFVDTAAVAHVLGGLGREFARPEVAEAKTASPKATADALTDVILRGLERR